MQLQLKLFQLYHNKQELTEKREISEKKKDEVTKLEKRKEVSDEEIKSKKKELATYNKELANDEQKVKELVNSPLKKSEKFIFILLLGRTNQQTSTNVYQSEREFYSSSEKTRSSQVRSD